MNFYNISVKKISISEQKKKKIICLCEKFICCIYIFLIMNIVSINIYVALINKNKIYYW